jgi:hypothetical protein
MSSGGRTASCSLSSQVVAGSNILAKKKKKKGVQSAPQHRNPP